MASKIKIAKDSNSRAKATIMDKDELERRKRRKKISYRSIDCMNASGVGVARTRRSEQLR